MTTTRPGSHCHHDPRETKIRALRAVRAHADLNMILDADDLAEAAIDELDNCPNCLAYALREITRYAGCLLIGTDHLGTFDARLLNALDQDAA